MILHTKQEADQRFLFLLWIFHCYHSKHPILLFVVIFQLRDKKAPIKWKAIWSFCHMVVHGNVYSPSKMSICPRRKIYQESIHLLRALLDCLFPLCSDPTLMEQSSGFNLTTHVASPQGKNMLTIKCRHLVYLK